MSQPDQKRRAAIRTTLNAFVVKRRNEVLAKIKGTDAAAETERKKQQEFFQLQPLLSSGANCVGQIQMATHIVKGIHPKPEVKVASSLKVDLESLQDFPLVGTHVLRKEIDIDATGNGAFNKKIYEVFLLLNATFDGVPILELLKSGDADACAALGETADQATAIAEALSEIDVDRCRHVASHTLAKQIYWPVGNDPHDDASYHLLAPLYPTSLVHRFYQTLQEDRFGEAAKAAREARKAGEWHERPVREYPNLAIQKLGGTKPQNISQLNSERRGDNCLLASLPPVWQSADVKPVLNVASLFAVFRWRKEVRAMAAHLRRYLESDPARNMETRERRDELVESLLDELMQYTAEVQTLLPGWSTDARCDLPSHQIAWLDPQGTDIDTTDMIDCMVSDFANWLNGQLRDPLPMGDAEYLYWRKQARELFKEAEREGVYEQ
jgi:CRISPR-associated protein Csy1